METDLPQQLYENLYQRRLHQTINHGSDETGKKVSHSYISNHLRKYTKILP